MPDVGSGESDETARLARGVISLLNVRMGLRRCGKGISERTAYCFNDAGEHDEAQGGSKFVERRERKTLGVVFCVKIVVDWWWSLPDCGARRFQFGVRGMDSGGAQNRRAKLWGC